MAAPTLCTVVPEDMRSRMAEAARMKSAAEHHMHQHAQQTASMNGYEDLRPGGPPSESSSRSSTSSSGSSSVSSGLLTGEAEPSGKQGKMSSAFEASALGPQGPAEVVADQGPAAHNRHTLRTLPRADLLVLGGDLAYPNPSNETYENRFFRCSILHQQNPRFSHQLPYMAGLGYVMPDAVVPLCS